MIGQTRKPAASLIAIAASVLILSPCSAQDRGTAERADAEAKADWTFEPVMLDSREGDSATLGFKYEVKGRFGGHKLPGDTGGPLGFNDPFGEFVLGYDGRGTVAASADRNPENFLDGRIFLDGIYNVPSHDISVGIFVKFEADQSFDAQQVVVGGHVTYSGGGSYDDNPDDEYAFGLDLGFGRVEPGDDAERKAALGATELEGYDRAEFEAFYRLNLDQSVIKTVELNYRYYAEIDAPTAIKASDMDVHQIGTIRLGLPQNLFVAYSVGKLPFDREADETIQIGLSYKLF